MAPTSPPFDAGQVSPSDAAVALRSFPRRFRSALQPPDESDEGRTDDVLHRRPSDGGLSAIEHAAWAGSAIDRVAEAFRRVMIEDDPLVELPPVNVAPPVDGGSSSLDEVMARLDAVTGRLADAIRDVHGAEWTRKARAGDRQVTALDIIRYAVRIGVENLRSAELTVSQVVGESVHGE